MEKMSAADVCPDALICLCSRRKGGHHDTTIEQDLSPQTSRRDSHPRSDRRHTTDPLGNRGLREHLEFLLSHWDDSKSQEAWERFYKTSYRYVFSWAHFLLWPKTEDIEDVVQDVYILFFTNFKDSLERKLGQNCRVENNACNIDLLLYWENYAKTLIRSVVIDRARKSKKRVDLETNSSAKIENILSSNDSPHVALDKEELRGILKESVDRLPEGERKVVTLRLCGYDYREIQSRLGITETSARKKYSRAAAKLGKALSKFLDMSR